MSLFATLAGGGLALADDTEILLISPDPSTAPQSNVLFIIDSSGSMAGEVETREFYDPDTVYPGAVAACDPDSLYWTTVNTVPGCSAANTQVIRRTAFVCATAQARLQGIGSYSGSMAQYVGDETGSAAWRSLLPGDSTGLVECAADSGVHGTGVGRDVYARKGSTPRPFTSDAGQEIDWAGSNVSNAVTVYDGNYLNYKANPVLVQRSKMDIVKQVSRVVLDSIDDINVGVMRFNDRDGGPVIQGIVDLDTNRAEILAAIDSITPGGRTPLAETLYESALYWRGLPAYYGENIHQNSTDPGALSQLSPEIYEQPRMFSCTKNFNVLLTDGQPVDDTEAPSLVDNLPNWNVALGHSGCRGGQQGDCLDDIAKYLFEEDVSTAAPGDQFVTTNTIGFAIDLPVLRATAAASGGEYFLADDVESLTVALLQVVANIQDRSLSFTAPAVAVNSFNRTQNLNELYLATFGARGKIHWPGNLKKYRLSGGQIVDANAAAAVNAATGFFELTAQDIWSDNADGIAVEEGGAANRIPTPTVRKIYTFNGSDNDLTAASNAVSVSNAEAYKLADFGLTGSATEPSIPDMIRWALGEDRADEDGDTNLNEARDQMGDPLHSEPAAVIYGGSPANPDTVVYTATNDGYVHAIDGATGVELWSFVPKEQMADFSKLFFNLNAQYKNYGVDGDIVPVTRDVDGDGVIEAADGDLVIIIFGMRRGGGNYYALNVTNKHSPRLLWQFSDPGIAQSWSRPAVARVKLAAGFGQNALDAVVVLGGGYDIAHDTIAQPLAADGQGAGIYMLDLMSGDVLWRAGREAAAELSLPTMTRAIPSAVRVVDLNGDGFADRMYASDLGGQLWRFDIHSGKAPDGIGTEALVTGGVIAQLGAEGSMPTTNAETRRFYSAPDVSLFNDNARNRRFIALSIGSGYRAHPLNNTTNERFYSIRDKNVFGAMTQAQYDALAPITESTLLEVSGTTGTTIAAANDGWMFTLPANQKVLTESTTFNNDVYFVSFSPDADNAAAVSCAAGAGRNFLYRVSVVNGDPIVDLSTVVSGTEDQLRVSNLAQGGIAPSPRFLFPSPAASCPSGDNCSESPVGCVGVECFSPDFPNNPVRTLWTQAGID